MSIRLLSVLLALHLANTAQNTGCEKRLSSVCPGWKEMSEEDCLSCGTAHLQDLTPNCTQAQVQTKCSTDSGGTCEQKLDQFCPLWKLGEVPECEACVTQQLSKIQPDCTNLSLAKAKCSENGVMPPPVPAPRVQPKEGAPQPHIVLFVIDDQGWSNVGYRNEHIMTPNIDQFAKEGVVLDRHYVYRWCAPTRSSFMTGREPYHVWETVNYVTRGMTMLPRKLQQVGYVTHQVGKWHQGSLRDWMTPLGRGFNTSYGYLGASEDHYSQVNSDSGCKGVDLWDTDKPAFGKNGTYGEYRHNETLQKIISEHDASVPMFIYAALQVMHAPQQVPDKYSNLYADYVKDFRIENGMATIADEVFGQLKRALIDKGMWENTLVILSSDNGGPAGASVSGKSGNNFPFRGGKETDFEGGIRVPAALGGGFLPSSLAGRTLAGYMHASDWYPTVCGLAGIDAQDTNPADATIPDIDGHDLWPYITGAIRESPRTEIMVAAQSNDKTGAFIHIDAAGDWKLIRGTQRYAFWQGPIYPNATTDHSTEQEFDCGEGCLFNIRDDPNEYFDLSSSHPQRLAALQEKFEKRAATRFSPKHLPEDPKLCQAYMSSNGGFKGPYYTWSTAAADKMLLV